MAAAGLRGVIASILRKVAPKRLQSRVVVGKEKTKEGAFADNINEDKLNVQTKKRKVKGIKKFLSDLRIFNMFQMISVFWSRKIVGSFLKKEPSPVEYGTMPTVTRRMNHNTAVKKMTHQIVRDGSPSYTYGLTKQQIRSTVRKEVADNPKEYRTFKGNHYTGKVDNSASDKATKRDAYKELMAKRQSEKDYTR